MKYESKRQPYFLYSSLFGSRLNDDRYKLLCTRRSSRVGHMKNQKGRGVQISKRNAASSKEHLQHRI